MDFQRGLVVRALAGRDKGGFFTVLEADADMAVICDGRRRSLEHPKRKKQKHLLATKTVLNEGSLQTNREIRGALRPFEAEGRFPQEEGTICRNRT
ncbi:KOW domain-containing RNA-binding protein [Anaeromassilibacillus senegalensis]|uniref:KOW domain-containing RNA-binding protein n=1 Tax=Anaeromassilibacillus senegalensis TaxID=1673717 RepID=UPI001FA76752|nr:KOW domain-containing RNA-binding protein [Anaeromassilibacillus senegalensis]